MKFTAIVLTFNESLHLARCLASLQDVAGGVVAVDCFSTDDTLEMPPPGRAGGPACVDKLRLQLRDPIKLGADPTRRRHACPVRLGGISRIDPRWGVEIDLSGLKAVGGQIPRALPWADIGRAVGARIDWCQRCLPRESVEVVKFNRASRPRPFTLVVVVEEGSHVSDERSDANRVSIPISDQDMRIDPGRPTMTKDDNDNDNGN
ncbi:hypothetical protein [uncultured Thiocystis sp.]|jgi:hypothetical protein|uniref:hypothetical protein n=1 Tax=uncultured Thiocystis sp. TaxID=1202134 RepID=UPI0025DA3489|nr:hypothetical protein [uncultured Thiocystis sp.]